MGRYVLWGYIAIGLLVWLVLYKSLSGLWDVFKWNDYQLAGESIKMTTLIAFGFATLLVLFLWRNSRINNTAIEIAAELKKVTWPSKKETYSSTVVVIITTIIISAILGLFDLIWSFVTSGIYTGFKT